MSDREDIEEILRNFTSESTTDAKRPVMDAFASLSRERQPLWGRRVPVYALAIAIVVVATVSFIVGRNSAVARQVHGPAATESGIPAQEMTWHAAERDVL